jgi:hypothetical protein
VQLRAELLPLRTEVVTPMREGFVLRVEVRPLRVPVQSLGG